MMAILARLEVTGFSIWIRETGWVFFGSLILHSLALGLVVGICLVLNLKILGPAARIPDKHLADFLPVVWLGLILVVLSGGLLLIAYPAKALTNPVFLLKGTSVLLALLITLKLTTRRILQPSTIPSGRIARTLAGVALVLWFTSIAAGRFLAYTHSILLASRYY